MKRNLFLFLIICLLTAHDLHGQSPGPSTTEMYNSQRKCRKQCEYVFNEIYNNGKILIKKRLIILYDYSNHYNKKLNKCFMLITENSVFGKKRILTDVNEDVIYGTVRVNKNNQVVACFLLEERCRFEEEWNKLVRPYMEE